MLLFTLITTGATAQGTDVLKGKVLDQGDEALIGAQVRWKDTKTAAVVGVDGSFTISRSSKTSTLVVSYIGYKSKEIVVGKGQNTVNVVLSDDAQSLDELVALGEKFKAYGIRVGYHNHQHELREHFDGKTPLEYLYDAGLAMELDVGHVKLAGGCPVAWLKKLAGRVPSIHAKPGGGNSVGGEGDANDWKAIFSAAAASGTKWAIVECETRRNTFEDVEKSMTFLKELNG